MRKNNKRHEILAAALRVVQDRGANHLTIDAVAEESGFSKGGVLYHFNTKQALLGGMLQNLLDENRQRVIEAMQGHEGEGLLPSLMRARARSNEVERQSTLALLAVAAEDSELIQPAKELAREWFGSIRSEADDSLEATVLLLASEGLRFLTLLGLNPLSKEEEGQINQLLVQRAGEV